MSSSGLDMILFLLIDFPVPEHLIFDYEKGSGNHLDIDHTAAKMADKNSNNDLQVHLQHNQLKLSQ